MEGQKKDCRLLLGLIPIALIVWLTLGTIDAQMRVSLTSELQTVLDTTRGGLRIWTAATIIRPWEVNGQRARTPFVALTANAFREQVEKRLLAGCDAHLTNLIKKQTLLTALVQANTLTVRTQTA